MLNAGKKFEVQFKSSIPENVMYHRNPDQPQSFQNTAKFSLKNKCDCFIYNYPLLLACELKSTKEKYMTVEMCKEDEGKKMIHWHQIQGLKEYVQYKGIIPGLILNFRINENDKEQYNELTYFIHINDFLRMMTELNKKSFNLLDLVRYNPMKIESIKKRTRFNYDVGSFLVEINNKYKV